MVATKKNERGKRNRNGNEKVFNTKARKKQKTWEKNYKEARKEEKVEV